MKAFIEWAGLGLTFLVGVVVLGNVTGCAGAQPVNYPALVQGFCAAAPTELEGLEADGVITGGADDTMQKIVTPDITQLCALAVKTPAQITPASIQAVSNAAVPALLALVASSDQTTSYKETETALLLGWQTTLNIALPYYEATQTPAASAVAAQ